MYKDSGIKCINDELFSVAVFGGGGGRKRVVKIRMVTKLFFSPFNKHGFVKDLICFPLC